MGRPSRREQRRNRQGPAGRSAKRRALKAAGGPLKISILTYPQSGDSGPTVGNDVALVRSALLYADEVELVSPSAFMVAAAVQLGAGGADSLMDLIRSLDRETAQHIGLDDDARAVLPVLTGLVKMSDKQIRRHPLVGRYAEQILELKHSYQEQVGGAAAEFQGVAGRMFADSGAEDLVPAMDADILTLSAMGLDTNAAGSSDIFENWKASLTESLQDPSKRLLFDKDMADLVRSMVDSNAVSPNVVTLKNAGEAAVGSGLIARLPSLPQAPTDELLDLRADLRGPMTRYRRAASRLARELETRAFDPEYSAEIDSLWISEVHPAIQEIKEEFADHALVKEVLRQYGTDFKEAVLSGASGCVLMGVSTLDQIAALVTGGLTMVAQPVAKAAIAKRSKTRELEKRDMFYLYEINERWATTM